MAELSQVERELLEHAAAGTTCDVSGRGDDERRVRAEVIYELCVGTRWPVHAKGVRLAGATIIDPLDFEYANLRTPLVLEYCDLQGALSFGFATAPAVDLTGSVLTEPLHLNGATIADHLDLSGAKLTGTDTDGNALFADWMRVRGSAFLSDGFEATGAIRLPGTTIDGDLDMSTAKLTGTDTKGNALFADRMRVRGSAFLSDGFEATGAIRLPGATIDGDLDMSTAKLTGTDTKGNALFADGMHVDDTFLRDGFEATGAIRLPGTTIDGDLDMSTAKLTGTDTDALVADGMRLGGSALLRDSFEATGAIRLLGAAIGGDLGMRTAKLTGTDADGDTVVGDQMRVRGDAYFTDGFEASSNVRLNGANIEGLLSFVEAGGMGRLILTGARCAQYEDDQASGPRVGELVLRGFRFDGLLLATDWRQRIEWVRRQGFVDWSPDPYEQLASYYTRVGDESSARRIQVAKHNDELTHLKTTKKKGSLGYRFWRRPFGWLVGYGYRRHRAGWLLVATLLAAGLVFRGAENEGAMVPDEPVQGSNSRPAACGEAYPCFNSVVYGADVVLPIIDFGQDSTWRPIETSGPGPLWIWARWTFIALGWALASVFVAAFTGLVQRT